MRWIWIELNQCGIAISQDSVSRWLVWLGVNRRCWLNVHGAPLGAPGKIIARYWGHMVHLDVNEGRSEPPGGLGGDGSILGDSCVIVY